jgi:pimeloyl-ACP methyl ester carboxylesterase
VDGAFWQWNDAWLNPAFRGFDIRADCTRITAPVLALQGDKDPYGTMAQIDQIDLPAHRIRRVALAGCGHSPHREAPAATLAAAVDFLSRID